MARSHSVSPIGPSSQSSSVPDTSQHSIHSRRRSTATQDSTSPASRAETPPLSHPNSDDADTLDAAISLLTGFTSQQLASVSKMVESAVNTALDERFDTTTATATATTSSRATAPAVVPSISGRRMSKIVSSAVKKALDERLGPSTTQSTASVVRHSTCNQEAPQPDPARIASSPQAESTKAPLPRSPPIIIHDFQTDQHKIKYRTDYPRLPPNAPRDHPHIVDINSIDDQTPQRGLGFADVVVTVLYMYDPRVLNDFLDFNKHSFDFQRANTRSGPAAPYIQRRIKFVTVCVLCLLVAYAVCADLQSQCGFLGEDGKTVSESFTYRVINEGTGAWAPVSVQGPLCKTLIGSKRVEGHVRTIFAKRVLEDKIWESKKDSKFIIKAR